MSVSHPYLKQLKVHIIKFCENAANEIPITDQHASMLQFCRTLEDIMATGLRYSSYGDRSPWKWVSSLGQTYPTYKLTAPLQWCIEQTAECKQVSSDVGRTRLFLRCALKKGVLALVLRLLKEQKQLLKAFYDETRSILGDEILFELFVSMVAPLAQCQFSLFIANASFLDETWDLPLYVQYELVPTDRLGIEITIVKGRIIVIDVEVGSVADEDAKIEPGDVVDYLFGESMRNGSRRKFATLMREYRGAPIYIGVVKGIGRDGQFYKPLLPILEQAGIVPSVIMNTHLKRHRELQESAEFPLNTTAAAAAIPKSPNKAPFEEKSSSQPQPGQGGTSGSSSSAAATATSRRIAGQQQSAQLVDDQGCYPCVYLGEAIVGATGTIDKIERGVFEVIRRYSGVSKEEANKKKRRVLLDLGETDVLVACAKTHEPVVQHGYPEIASCGRRVDYPMNFSYIAGETTCTLAKEFTCYVFEANSDEQARLILKEIARGFDRTHWAV